MTETERKRKRECEVMDCGSTLIEYSVPRVRGHGVCVEAWPEIGLE